MFEYSYPDARGHFGPYGGSFASETLTHALEELSQAYAQYQNDPDFLAEFRYELAHFVGRPSPVYHAARMSQEMGGAQIYLKREDLNHTGAHKINNVIGQAMRDWVANVDNTFYIIGTVAGPAPYPAMVRDFQSVIGTECLTQMPELLKQQHIAAEQPDVVVACVGGGSNAMGIFYPYIPFETTKLIGVEAAGEGLESGKHSASLQKGSSGVLHGNRTFILQNENGQITETHSISAGLDYPGVGPEHAWLQELGRAQYVGITDQEALEAFHYLCRTEGIIPALESSHAVAYAMKLAKTMRADQSILVSLSGRGDKDIGTVADLTGGDYYDRPSMRGHTVKGGPAA